MAVLGAAARTQALEAGFSVGLTAHPRFATETSDSGHELRKPLVSVHVDVPLSRSWSIGLHPTLLHKGLGWDYSRYGRVDIRSGTLELPLILRSRPSASGLFFEAGGGVGLPLSRESTNPSLLEPPDTATTLGLVLGGGYEWRLGTGHAAFVGAQYRADLTDTYRPVADYPFREGGRYRVLLVHAGLSLRAD